MVRLEPVHPGEILKHDFMEPLGLSAARTVPIICETTSLLSLV